MNKELFSGTIYFLCSFDVGDEIDLRTIHSRLSIVKTQPFQSPYFKNYHKPLLLNHSSYGLHPECDSIKIYNFGVISLLYKFKFEAGMDDIKGILIEYEKGIFKKSSEDAKIIFYEVEKYIRNARFFHLYKIYPFVQINPKEDMSPYAFKEKYPHEIVSTLRFETEHLSEYKKNEILNEAFGYYRGDLLIVDYDATLAYDSDYQDILEIFEFANIRHMELQFFDRVLDRQLNYVYENESYKIPIKAYFPVWGMMKFDPIGELAKMRVEISVISERLWSCIKFSEEQYYLEIYQIINKKMDFQILQDSIDKKLEVIRHILEVHDNRATNVRYDVLNILIVLLIFMEFILGLMNYLK